MEKLKFKRAVLSRELSLEEIKYICQNSDIEIEAFMHGALCISYSGQCLLSSMIGGRSGNRGKCAQPCRLPYELIEKDSHNKDILLDRGYLLSPRDLCTLDSLPELIQTGVSSLKIEGRMKSPEYVATVTRIYRKYIDLAYKYILEQIDSYNVESKDKLDLMQVFNRGGFSKGHLDSKENRNLIFKEKPNNMGLFLGNVSKITPKRGLISCELENNLSIGDGISFENENTKYTISELLKNGNNIKNAVSGEIVTFGRMKGNIKIGDKIFKILDKNLSNYALHSIENERFKLSIECNIHIKNQEKVKLDVCVPKFNLKTCIFYDYIPEKAQNAPINIDKIYNQFIKTKNTIFEFTKLEIDLDDNLFMPVSVINDIRRTVLEYTENNIYNLFKRSSMATFSRNITSNANSCLKPKIAVLLNILKLDYKYSCLKNIDRIYIPLKYFLNSKYKNILNDISKISRLYIYMPTVIRKSYMELLKLNFNKFNDFKISGFVISNLSHLKLLEELNLYNFEIIGNYTLNIYNSYTANDFANFNLSCVTISPELDKDSIINICKSADNDRELIVYGNIPVMTMNYCPLGKSNKCYTNCKKKCMTNATYFLKDRLGMYFRLIPDNIQTISTLYNSKILSIDYSKFNVSSVRIDILDETLNEINDIVNKISDNKRFEGKNYTNGNLNREI